MHVYLLSIVSVILSTSLLATLVWSAGMVQVTQKGGNLKIKGDREDNKIELSQSQANEITVTGMDGTGIVGGPTFTNVLGIVDIRMEAGNDVVTAPGVLDLDGSIHVNLGKGDDALTLSRLDVGGNIRAQGSAGEDTVLIGDETDTFVVLAAGDLILTGGGGADDLDIHDPIIQGSIRMIGGGGDDDLSVEFDNTSADVLGNLYMSGGPGMDTLELTDPVVGEKVAMNGGPGMDTIIMDDGAVTNQISSKTTVTGSSGVDTVTIANQTFNGNFVLALGPDDDSLNLSNSTFNEPATFSGGPGTDTFIALGNTFNNLIVVCVNFQACPVP